MRIPLVLAVSVSATAVLLAGYCLGYWHGSPVKIVVQPPAECEWVDEVAPPAI